MTATTCAEAIERDPETLEIFIEESLDACVRVEQLLLNAENGDAPPDLMTHLFRAVHTIKGTSAFLNLPNILSLSHTCEDLLSDLRDDPALAQPYHFALLVTVIDLLRKMVETLRDTNDEGAIEVAPTVAKIKQALQTLAKAEPQELTGLTDQLTDPVDVACAQPIEPPVAQVSFVAATAERGIDEDKPDLPVPQHASAVSEQEGTLRVSVAVLDKLMNLIGELVLTRNQMTQTIKHVRDGNGATLAACQRLSLVTTDLQAQVMKTRMQPISRVFERVNRMVRDLSKATGKQANCTVEGNTTEIDKALVEAIRDPIMHLVRNAMDHGIETVEQRKRIGKPATGNITVRAAHEGGAVLIEIEDDGKGMDPSVLRSSAVRKGIVSAQQAETLSDQEALDLIFHPGFSTAQQVTDISGRGVGMDVVKTHIERVGGQVELESTVGKGSVIRLRMPLTLAIIPALLVESRRRKFTIPQANLVEVVYLAKDHAQDAIEHIRGTPVYLSRGELLPLVVLSDLLQLPEPEQDDDYLRNTGIHIAIVTVGPLRYGLVVDQVQDSEEIVVKPLHGKLRELPCYAGATVLGDGEVVLILDVNGIASMLGLRVLNGARRNGGEATQTASSALPHIVIEFGQGVPCAIPLTMVARMERVPRTAIEKLSGREYLQYHERVMPILRAESALGIEAAPVEEEQAVLVFDFGDPVGLAVHRIVDVASIEPPAEGSKSDVPHTLATQVVLGRTSIFLDVYSLLRKLAPDFVNAPAKGHAPRILVLDDSNAMRASLSGFFRALGASVYDAPDALTALKAIRDSQRAPFAAIVTDIELPGMDGFGFIHAVQAEAPHLPVFAWTQHEVERVGTRALSAGAKACIHKGDREKLVSVLADNGICLSAPKVSRS